MKPQRKSLGGLIGAVALISVLLAVSHLVRLEVHNDGVPAAGSGWQQVFVDTFDGSDLQSGWSKYSGQPGGNPGGWWEPSHVTVSGGALHLSTYRDGGRWVSGGVMNSHQAESAYGKYEARIRMTAGYGVKYAVLLWPKSEKWPEDGEIDLAEDGGGDRSQLSATLHYGADNSIIQRSLDGIDLTKWHDVGVEWTPGRLDYTFDGRVWASVDSSGVPTKPMDLAIQTETGVCGSPDLDCPNHTTPSKVVLDVDWVAVWRRNT